MQSPFKKCLYRLFYKKFGKLGKIFWESDSPPPTTPQNLEKITLKLTPVNGVSLAILYHNFLRLKRKVKEKRQ